MKSRFTTVDICAIITELRERWAEQEKHVFLPIYLQSVYIFCLILKLWFNLCLCSLLGMRVANVYDIDNKTYLIRLGKTNISRYTLYLYLLGLFRLHTRSLMTMFVCYNYADKFLHLYIETHVSQTFVNSSKTLFYYGGTFNVFRGPNMVSNF